MRRSEILTSHFKFLPYAKKNVKIECLNLKTSTIKGSET